MSTLMEKFLNGELSEFEAERLERELESQDASAEMLELAESRFEELEQQASKSPLRRALEIWAAWFARAGMATVSRTSLAVKLAGAVVLGAGAGVLSYAYLETKLDPAVTAETAAVAPAAVQAPEQPSLAAKTEKKKSVKKTAKAVPAAASKKEEVELQVVKGKGKQAEDGEPVLMGYDPAPALLREDLTIEVRLMHSRHVSVQIVDSNGSLTKTVHTGNLPKGTWFFFLDEKDPQWRSMPAGDYAVEVNVGEQLLRRDFNVTGQTAMGNGA